MTARLGFVIVQPVGGTPIAPSHPLESDGDEHPGMHPKTVVANVIAFS